MPTVLIVVGLAVMVVGLVVFLLPAPKPAPAAQGVVGDIGEVLKQVNALLDKLDKRYRPGLVLMFFGLALVGLGVFLQASDAKDAADAAKNATAVVRLL